MTRMRVVESDLTKVIKPASSIHTGYSYHHAIVFLTTFASYLQIYALRKTLSYVKSTVVEVWVPTNQSRTMMTLNGEEMVSPHFFSTVTQAETFLGALDSILMFSYALGLYFLGALSDRFDPRVVLCVGMCCSSILTAIFGAMTEALHFYNVPFYVCIWIMNGVAQSVGWPSSVKIMDNWFGKQKRGLIFGLWSSAASVGSIVGAHICAEMLPYGYEYPFLVNASLLFSIAVVTFFGIVSNPKELDPPSIEVITIEIHDDMVSTVTSSQRESINSDEKHHAISFFKALLLPGVIAYALSYTCLKSVNYSIFFWLPYYMRANFGWDPSTSATLSTYYDWGGILGSTVCGFASDLLGKRSPILVSILAFSIFSLGGYANSPDDKLVNAVLNGILGVFASGATNLVSSAVTADLGRQQAVMGNKEALGMVSGIIEGSGSAGAAIGQAVLPLIADYFGWNSIFYMFMLMLFISLVCLAKLCYRETKEVAQDIAKKILSLTSGIGDSESIESNIFVIALGSSDCASKKSEHKLSNPTFVISESPLKF